MPALLALEDVRRTYDMGAVQVHALRGVSLEIAEGEFVAIMGTSGSGKSTLLNLLGCLDRPTSGRYVLGGEDVARKSKNELAEVRNKMIGFVFQSFNLLARTTALENVELPLLYQGLPTRERQTRALAALGRVGLGDRADHVPNQLSGGQQQRVAIARAIVGRPRILLADEPTGNLDSRTTVEVMALFQELSREGLTIALVTHEPDVAAFASRVVVVKDGLLRADRRQTPVVADPSQVVDEDAAVLAIADGVAAR